MISQRHGWYHEGTGLELWWKGVQVASVKPTIPGGVYLSWRGKLRLEASNVHLTLEDAKQHAEETIPELERLADLIEVPP